MTATEGLDAAPGPIWREAGEGGAPLVAGAPEGPLAGRTVAVKDLFAIAGHRIGAGNPARLAEARVEPATAPAVAALLDAGAAIAGIAHTDEFAYSIAGRNAHTGTPPNAAVPGALPGGSSSGPASAVASGLVDLGLATDTAGSIRVPASYQGIWGLRTTHGAVDARGLLPLAESFDTIGWLSRHPQSLLAAARASLGGGVAGASASLPGGAPTADVAIPTPAPTAVAPALLALAEPAVRAAFARVLDRGIATGALAAPIEVDLGDPAELQEAFRVVQAAEAWAADGAWVEAHPGALGPDVASRFATAAAIAPEAAAAARRAVAAARARIEAALGDRVLLLPSAPGAAPDADADAAAVDAVRTATLRLTVVAGIAGRPALSAPLLRVPDPRVTDGAPVGFCLVGPRGSDLALVRLGASLADVLRGTS